MNINLLHNEVQQFITTHLKSDLSQLILKGSPFPQITVQELAEQVISKSKCKFKLPTWYNAKKIYYPNKVNIEQCSSEITARYKSNLIDGTSIIDLTGGFGVDCYYFSKKIDTVVHCEIDAHLSGITKNNYKVLHADNIECINTNGINYLKETKGEFDWIYIDPSRRNEEKGKVFLLRDCLPNVPEQLDLLMKKAKHVLIKLSPVLDINSAIKSLRYVKEVHVIAVNNEVKELLLIIEKGYSEHINIKTINRKNDQTSNFESPYPSQAEASYSHPKKYLYEPNAAILKAGLFNEVSSKLNVCKLHNNSHLYTSDILNNFPGRRFLIKEFFKYNRKELKKRFSGKKANLSTRNFKLSVKEIRKTSKINEGGNDYLFFTINLDNKPIVIHCEKV